MHNDCINGIVTRYTNYKENDRILSVFTPERGRVDAKARGCRKAASPLLPASQLFVYGEFEIIEVKDKKSISKADIKESFFPLREDVVKYAVSSSIVQLSNEVIHEDEPNPDLFSLLYYSLSYLSYGSSDPRDIMAAFLIKYLDIIGYRPSVTACAKCGRDIRFDFACYYSVSNGGAVCASCSADVRPVKKITLEILRRILLLQNIEINKVVLNDRQREEVLSLLIQQIETSFEFGIPALSFYKRIKI